MTRWAIQALAALLAWLVLLPQAALAVNAQQITTPKGFKVWFVEDHTVPIIALNYAFRGGAAADPKDRRGLATFLSAMLDEGAGDLDSAAFQERMEELAFSMTHSAGQDWFSGSFRTLAKNRRESFRLLALALQKPRFDNKPLERIRRQLLVGLRQKLEDPEQQAWRAFRKALFGDHPYALDTDGDMRGIAAITADDLRALHRRLFARDNLIITAAGDIAADELARLVDATFGPLPAKSAMPAISAPHMPKQARQRIIRRPIPQTIILMGHEGLLRNDPDFIPAYVANFILGGGGFGSRLTEVVREKNGLAYSVYSAMFAYQKAGVFFAQAGTRNARAAQALALMRQEIRRMAKDGPTQQELDEAKRYLIGSWPLRFDSTTKIASVLMGFRQQGLGIDYINRRNDMMRALTVQDVQRGARRLLKPAQLQVVLYGNPAGMPGGKATGAAATRTPSAAGKKPASAATPAPAHAQ